MEQIMCFTNYLKTVVKTKGFWWIVPFAFLGFVLAGVFYIYSAVFMLIDLIRFELKKILYGGNESISGAAQFVKFGVGFFFYLIFAIISIILTLPLALVFLLVYCCFFVSSIGRVRGNPFFFHFITASF